MPRTSRLSLVLLPLIVLTAAGPGDALPLPLAPSLFRGSRMAIPELEGNAFGPPPPPVLLNPCWVRRPENEEMLERTQRRLYQTACQANLWFDGLFGPSGNAEAARSISGRLEIAGFYSEADQFEQKVRFDARWEFPNLDRRLNAFLGRDDEDDFVRGQADGFGLRSSFFNLERDERWLAGLGYSLPGNDRQRVDFSVGARLRSSPEVFVQGRLRRNHYFGDKTALRFRQVVFYQNRDGFGATTSLDIDRVLSTRTLFRWGSRVTRSEATDGADWRSAAILYQNLPGDRAIAAELFATGETQWEVPLREYGTRLIYRQRFLVDGVHAEAIVGYSWPREDLSERRKGSTNLGFGIDIAFGREKKGR